MPARASNALRALTGMAIAVTSCSDSSTRDAASVIGEVDARIDAGAADAAAILADAGPPKPFPEIELGVVPVATGLSQPLAIMVPPGETRYFVAEKTGAVVIVEDGRKRARPFLEVPAFQGEEEGLLGLAFHPGYATNGRVFVLFTGADPAIEDDSPRNIHIWELRRSDADPSVADATHKTILDIDHHQGSEHNGGNIVFGPDGFLYVGVGDGGGIFDPVGSSRLLTTRLSKILRIDVDGGDPYRSPPDNPFAAMSDPAARDVWLWGFRNPWRFSFDRLTGDLWIGDVGQSCWEEIDVARAGKKGLDFGWATVEGNDHEPVIECGAGTATQPGSVPPALEYPHGKGWAVVGGYVYRGAAIPELAGMYFFSDYVVGFVRSFWASAPVPFDMTRDWTAALRRDAPGLGGISTFGEDPDGELLLCGLLNGTCWRIVKK